MSDKPRPTPEMDALFARHTGEMEKLIPALFSGEITPTQYNEHTLRQVGELMAHAREMERQRDLAREFQAAIDTEIVMSLELAEVMVASERLGGNAVKESFWLGELAALMRMQNVIHASATATREATFTVSQIRHYLDGGIITSGDNPTDGRIWQGNDALRILLMELDDPEDGIKAVTRRQEMTATTTVAAQRLLDAWDSKTPLAWQPENNRELLEGLRSALMGANRN